jgi:hypothetical protein
MKEVHMTGDGNMRRGMGIGRVVQRNFTADTAAKPMKIGNIIGMLDGERIVGIQTIDNLRVVGVITFLMIARDVLRVTLGVIAGHLIPASQRIQGPRMWKLNWVYHLHNVLHQNSRKGFQMNCKRIATVLALVKKMLYQKKFANLKNRGAVGGSILIIWDLNKGPQNLGT